jgi:hypothetical protein
MDRGAGKTQLFLCFWQGFSEKLVFRVVLLWSFCGEVRGKAGKLTVFATRLRIGQHSGKYFQISLA